MSFYIHSFNIIRNATHCPFARSSKINYAPEWCNEIGIINNLENAMSSFIQFTQRAKQDSLDGYAIIAPGDCGDTLQKLAGFTNKVLTYYSENDPAFNYCMQKNILTKSWQFHFNHRRLFIITFSSCYPANHARFSFGQFATIILFQPDESFTNKRIPRGTNPKMLRELIRNNFAKNKRCYDSKILTNDYEAYRYVKPLNCHDEPIKWWELDLY